MKRSFAPFLLLSMLVPALALAGPAEDKGLEIAEEADRRDEGFSDTRSNMVMILRNKRGQESKRELEIRTLEVKDDGDKSMTVFHTPRDVRGTALLTYSHPVDADEQWLYLPALRRVKRIASNNKSGPFMGSEFAYEDFASQEVEKYTYKYLKDDKVDGVDCFLVEQYPVSKDSGYTRLQAWIDKDEYRLRKIDFYDRKGELLKTLTPSGYKQYLGKHWRAHKMNMVNHQNGKSTELIWSDFKFKTGLKEGDFTRTRLQQVL
ncbi:MAG: outer membrane lipoprotein-sorting protein [Polyangiales bacterium]